MRFDIYAKMLVWWELMFLVCENIHVPMDDVIIAMAAVIATIASRALVFNLYILFYYKTDKRFEDTVAHCLT